ncbi:signal peptidase [Halorubrum alkaliphilum]|uniref:Signal peptidase n=1 Tax=Halorubrum alkaliphilum TaxID=261290 RepID=A0A8T4GC64_9EURY|nr:signal peptidase I [Halorubrum alkaliphilum]MBP1922044.1 signal peptidase [Halorubrum alkaliphilum]
MNSHVPIRRIANVLGIVLLIAVVAPFVVYAVPAVVGAEYSFVVLTASMTPAIAPGDVVIVDERDPSSIAEGDVITFVRGDNEVPVTHRVIGVIASGDEVAFETQGDANDAADAGLVPAANVLGVVAFTIPYLGYVIQFADSPVGFIALVVVPFGLLALSEVWNLYRARTRVENDGGDGNGGDGDADESATETPESGRTGGSGLVVTERTVQGAVGVLLAFVPYAGYVAYTLRSGLTIAVATGTSLGLLIGLVLLVTGGNESSAATPETTDVVEDADLGGRDDDPGEPMATDGVTPTDDDGPAENDDRSSRRPGVFDDPVIEPAMDGGRADEAER